MVLHTQRVLIPGGIDRVTAQLLSREQFERMKPEREIKLLGGITVLRAECFWVERHFTFSLQPEIARRLGLILLPRQGEERRPGEGGETTVPQQTITLTNQEKDHAEERG